MSSSNPESQSVPPASSSESSTSSNGAPPLNEQANIQGVQLPIYSSNPCSIVSGLTRGTSNILVGACLGTLVLLAGPVKGAIDGYKEYGLVGSLGGVILGTIASSFAASAAIAGGALSGCWQVCMGLFRTPKALVNSTLGMTWDDDTQHWTYYDLQKEQSVILPMSEHDFTASLRNGGSMSSLLLGENDIPTDAADGGNANSNFKQTDPSANVVKKHVSDRTLYDILGVEPEATAAEVKKGYYIKARQHHPDRHHGDPDAHSKFQKIGEAYQILSDERLRNVYDQRGKDAIDEAPKMDASSLYAMVFGSENFEHIIGELKFASQIKSMTDPNSSDCAELLVFRQKKREVQLAVILARKLDTISTDGEEGFKEKMKIEATELGESAFGGTLLSLIGSIYEDNAHAAHDVISSIIYNSKQTGLTVFDAFSVVGSVFSTSIAAHNLYKLQQKSEDHEKAEIDKLDISEEEKTAKKSKINAGVFNMPTRPAADATDADKDEFKDTIKSTTANACVLMWQLTKMDIRATLASVCMKVLSDTSVSPETLKCRLRALAILGKEYMAKGVSTKAGLDDVLDRFGMFASGDVPTAPANGDTDGNNSNSDAPSSTAQEQQHKLSDDEIKHVYMSVPTLSVTELKESITRLGGDHSSCIEKSEMQMTLKSLLLTDATTEVLQYICITVYASDTAVADTIINSYSRDELLNKLMC